MKLTKSDIEQLDRIRRINLINSVSGVKPANLIGTRSASGQTNLATFSSVIHLGSNPALLGFILRPHVGFRRHTFENLSETGYYTINHVHRPFIEQAHQTSAKYGEEVSEFAACGFMEEYIDDFPAPFVKESRIKLGIKFEQQIPIELNGTSLIIGSIQLAIVPDEAVDESGHIDLGMLGDVATAGSGNYYAVEKVTQMAYARTEKV